MNQDITTFSELIDKLMTVNIKLYTILDKSALIANQGWKTTEDMIELGGLNIQNIELVKMRSKLKTAIDNKLNEAITNGGCDILQEAKSYGEK